MEADAGKCGNLFVVHSIELLWMMHVGARRCQQLLADAHEWKYCGKTLDCEFFWMLLVYCVFVFTRDGIQGKLLSSTDADFDIA